MVQSVEADASVPSGPNATELTASRWLKVRVDLKSVIARVKHGKRCRDHLRSCRTGFQIRSARSALVKDSLAVSPWSSIDSNVDSTRREVESAAEGLERSSLKRWIRSPTSATELTRH